MRKWAADVGEELLARAQVALDAAQRTAFESHLIRSFKKSGDARKSSVQKYLGLYASVTPSSVVPQIWERAQKIVAGTG